MNEKRQLPTTTNAAISMNRRLQTGFGRPRERPTLRLVIQSSDGEPLPRHGHTVSHKMCTYEDPSRRIPEFPKKVGSPAWTTFDTGSSMRPERLPRDLRPRPTRSRAARTRKNADDNRKLTNAPRRLLPRVGCGRSRATRRHLIRWRSADAPLWRGIGAAPPSSLQGCRRIRRGQRRGWSQPRSSGALPRTRRRLLPSRSRVRL